MPPVSNALLYRMDQGIPGCVSRQGFSQVEAQIMGATPFAAYGMPVKMVAGVIVPLAVVGDVLPYGWLIRPFPSTGTNPSDPLGTTVPQTSGICNVLVKGYLTIRLNAGIATAAANGAVYFRYANPSGGAIVGGVEGAAVASTTVALTNAHFMGPADANGNVEIYFDHAA